MVIKILSPLSFQKWCKKITKRHIQYGVLVLLCGSAACIVGGVWYNARATYYGSLRFALLSPLRAQAELYYDANHGSFDGICGTIPKKEYIPFGTVLSDIASYTDSDSYVCNEEKERWAISFPYRTFLKKSYYICIDISESGITTIPLAPQSTTCTFSLPSHTYVSSQ